MIMHRFRRSLKQEKNGITFGQTESEMSLECSMFSREEETNTSVLRK
jgi:hypothetical protein